MKITASQQEAAGLPVVRNAEALTQACRALGLLEEEKDLVWKENQTVGAGPKVTGYEVKLPGWMYPCYFDTTKGEVGFDNYSIYTSQHAEVRAGRVRLGAEGKWGNFDEMLKLETAYAGAASTLMTSYLESQAAMKGEMARVISETEDEYIMEIIN